jgi:hypothetical protein
MISWLCVTLFDLDWVFCMWLWSTSRLVAQSIQNTSSCIMASGDMITKYFHIIFQIKPLLNIFFFIKSKTPFLIKGVFTFKTQVRQELEMKFTLYEHSFHFYKYLLWKYFHNLFPIFKDSRNGENTPLVLFLSLKIMGMATMPLLAPYSIKWFW